MRPVSRKEAQTAGLKRYFTGKPCSNDHTSERSTGSKRCLACDALRKRTHYAANSEKERRRCRAKQIAQRAKYAAFAGARRAQKVRATPAWACKLSIENLYAEALRLAKATGVPHHVDHIVPLRHPSVCGLHVYYNLRAIPAVDNLKKHNAFIQ